MELASLGCPMEDYKVWHWVLRVSPDSGTGSLGYSTEVPKLWRWVLGVSPRCDTGVLVVSRR